VTDRQLARTLDAVANQMQIVVGVVAELRRSSLIAAHTLAQLEGEVDRVVRLLRTVQPTRKKEPA
jgi:hypothetical protein